LAEIRPSLGGIDILNVADKAIKSDWGSHTNDLWITVQSLDNEKIEVSIGCFRFTIERFQAGHRGSDQNWQDKTEALGDSFTRKSRPEEINR
jgi:hypothetical protein